MGNRSNFPKSSDYITLITSTIRRALIDASLVPYPWILSALEVGIHYFFIYYMIIYYESILLFYIIANVI